MQAAIPRETFLELMKKHAGAEAIVCLLGLPDLEAADLEAIGKSRPKVIVATLANPQPSLEQYTSGLVQLTVEPRLGAASVAQKVKTAEEWRKEAYRLVTPENAAALLAE